MRERDPPGSLQRAVISAMPQSPLQSCCQCRCLVLRQWSARSVPPLLNTATRSLSDSVRWLEFLHSVAPEAAYHMSVRAGISYMSKICKSVWLLPLKIRNSG